MGSNAAKYYKIGTNNFINIDPSRCIFFNKSKLIIKRYLPTTNLFRKHFFGITFCNCQILLWIQSAGQSCSNDRYESL